MKYSGPLKRAIQQRNWERAEELLSGWLKDNPNDARGWYWTAVCLEKKGRIKEALTAAKRAAELDPEHGATKSLLSELEDAPETILETSSGESSVPSSVSMVPATEADSDEAAIPATEVATHAQTPTQALSQWKEGDTFEGRYEVRQVIRGGMGEVAFVFDQELGLELAVKTPLPRVLASASGRTRFIREAEAWIALGLHPNICTAFYLRELGGFPRLFIEYIDGGSLRNWLKFVAKRDLSEKLDLAIQIASGMEHAHSFLWRDAEGAEHRGIVHRDLKPANILLGSDGLARVTDFGLVGKGSEGAGEEEIPALPASTEGIWGTVTMGGSVMGTPPYMPPEQWGGAHLADAPADIYAYGAILFEIFCGLRPFSLSPEEKKGRPELQLARWKQLHLETRARNPLSLNPGLDEELSQLMLKCLEKSTSDRPADFETIGNTLRAIYSRLLETPYPRPRPRASRLLADSLNNRGVSYQSLQREMQARKAWEDALRVDPHHREAGYNLSLFRWLQGATPDETRSSLPGFTQAEHGEKFEWHSEILKARLLLLLQDWKPATEILKSCFEASNYTSRVGLDYALALCAQATRIEQKPTRETGDFNRDSTPKAQSEEGDEGASALWNTTVSVLGRCGGVLQHDPRLLVAYALASSRLGRTKAAQRLMAAAIKYQPDLPPQVKRAAARVLPGQIPRFLMESTGTRVVHIEIAQDRALAVGLLYDSRIVVWDLDSCRIQNLIKLESSRPRSMALDASRNLVYIATEVEAVAALSLDNGQIQHRLAPHSGFLNDLKVSADGRKLIGVGTARTVFVWDLEDHRLLASFPSDIGYLTRATIALDCRTALIGGSSGSALLIDLEKGNTLHQVGVHGGVVSALSLSPGARIAAIGSEEGRISVWDLRESGLPRTLKGHTAAISLLCVGERSNQLLSGSRDGTLRLWDLEKEQNLSCLDFGEPIQAGTSSIDFSQVLIGAGIRKNFLIRLDEAPQWRPNWAISSPISVGEMETKSREFRRHMGKARRALEDLRLEEAIESLETARNVPGFDKTPELLELNEALNRILPRKSLRSAWEERPLAETEFPVYAVAVNRDATIILSADGDRKTRAYLRGKTVELSAKENWAERVLDITPSGQLALSAGLENELHLWDLEKMKLIRSLKGHEGQINAVDLRFDAAFALSASADGSLRYWDTESGLCLKILEGHRMEVLDCAFHPSGEIAASCGEDGILLWDLGSGTVVTTMGGSSGTPKSVLWTADGRKLISGGSDSKIRLWNPQTGRTIQSLNAGRPIECLALSGDDRFLCSGDQSGALRLWDLRARQCIAVNTRHQSKIFSIAMPKNAQRCFSASADGSLRAWYFDWTPDPTSRHSGKAKPYMEIFLQQQQQVLGAPRWSKNELAKLVAGLQERGFRFLSTEDVEKELRKIVQDSEKTSLRDDLEVSRQMAAIRSPAEKEKRRSAKKTIAWSSGIIILLLLLIISALPPSGPAYNVARRLEMRHSKKLDVGAVLASVDDGNHCSPTEKEKYIQTLRNSRHFSEAVQAADCLSSLEVQSLPEIMFRIIRSIPDQRISGDQRQIMTAFLAEAPEAVCPILAASLDDELEAVRSISAEALALHESPGCQNLFLDASKLRDPLARMAVASHFNTLVAAGDLPAGALFPYLEEYQQSAWPEIRRSAADSLRFFQGKKVNKLATLMLKDKDPQVRSSAENYLSNYP